MSLKISELTAVSAITDADVLPLVNGGATKKLTVAQMVARILPVSLTASVSGTLPVANGGTGITSLGSGVATFLGTPSGANLASALTTALPVSKGGTGLTAVGSALQALRTNAGATALEFYTPASAGWAVASRITALDANHLHAWELTDASGNFVDTGSSASKVDLTATGTPLYATPGLVGACAMFGYDANSDVNSACATVLISAFSDLPLTNFTLEFWYRSYIANLGWLAGGDSNGGGNVGLDGNGAAAGAIAMTVRATSFKNSATLAPLLVSSGSTWHHCALVYDTANGNDLVYLDGEVVLKQTGQSGNAAWSTGTTPRFSIALGQNSAGQFRGQMSRLRLSNIVRSQSYMRTVYQTGMAY